MPKRTLACEMFILLRNERATTLPKCPYINCCTGIDCRLNGQIPPQESPEDIKQQRILRQLELKRAGRMN